MRAGKSHDFFVSVWETNSIYNPERVISMAEANLEDKQEIAGHLMFFARYCAEKFRFDCAQEYLEKVLELVISDDEKAFCLLSIGQVNEGKKDFETAIRWYGKAFSLKPGSDRQVWYFLHNNIGYCLNQVKRHKEATKYCRLAIAISPEAFNAHKNLGVALEGLGRYAVAAKSYVDSCRQCPIDGRALRHLQDLVAAHPDVLRKIHGLQRQIDACEKAEAANWQ